MAKPLKIYSAEQAETLTALITEPANMDKVTNTAMLKQVHNEINIAAWLARFAHNKGDQIERLYGKVLDSIELGLGSSEGKIVAKARADYVALLKLHREFSSRDSDDGSGIHIGVLNIQNLKAIVDSLPSDTTDLSSDAIDAEIINENNSCKLGEEAV